MTRRWVAVRASALGLGVLLMVVLLARLGPLRIVKQLADAGPAAIWLLVAYAAGTALSAIPWHIVLPEPARPGLGAAISSRFAASGANALVPLFGFGGEPVRLLWLRPGTRAAGVAAIVMDRLIYALASAVFLLVGVIVAAQLAALPESYTALAALSGVALLLISVVAIWMVARHRIADRIHRLILRLRRSNGVADGSLAGSDIDAILTDMVAHRGRVTASLAIDVIARFVLALEIYAGFRATGVTLSWDTALVFAAVPVLLSFVGAVVPSQIGLQEGTQAMVASALGVSPATAVAVVLLQRIRQLVTAGFAWMLIAAMRKPAGSDPGVT